MVAPMGADGYGPFDNDDVMDFLDELTESRKPGKRLRKAMEAVLKSKKYVEAPDMSAAVAAAALVIARQRGLSLGEVADETLAELDLEPDPFLRHLAGQVLARAFYAQNNEWYELWDEAEGLDAVRSQIQPFIAASRE
jgi:uncharacterized protein (DUF1778 family)